MFGARCGTLSSSISMPVPARAAVSQVEQVSPAAPMSWMPATAPVASSSRHASQHELFHERIADLHRAALLLGGFLGQILRGKGRARETVATGGRADVEDRIADALGRAARDLLVAQHAEAEGVHERIALVGFVEIDLARDGRDAEAIAVVRDAATTPRRGADCWRFQQGWIRRRSDRPKRSEFSAQTGRAPIVKMSRTMPPTPVAAPWNGSTALGWLCDSILNAMAKPVADVDDAGVFLARADEDLRRLGGKGLQQRAGVLVGAVLAPHHGEDAQLGVIGFPSQDRCNAIEFFGRQSMFLDKLGSNGRLDHIKEYKGNGEHESQVRAIAR